MSGITSASLTLTYDPSDAVPREPAERAAWLLTNGPAPTRADALLEMPLIEWLRVRAQLTPQGQVSFKRDRRWDEPDAQRLFERALLDDYARTGTPLAQVPEPLWERVVAQIDQAYAAFQATLDAEAAVERQKQQAAAAQFEADVANLKARGFDACCLRRNDLHAWAVASPSYKYDDCYSAAFGAGWRDRAHAAAKARNAEEQAANAAIVDAWVRDHGTASERARHAEKLLGEPELLASVRAWAFAGIDAPRYARLAARDHVHADDCAGDDVRFTVDDLTAVTAAQYERLQEVRAAAAQAPISLMLELRRHTAACQGCEGTDDVVTRDAVLVSGTWAGRRLSREYAL